MHAHSLHDAGGDTSALVYIDRLRRLYDAALIVAGRVPAHDPQPIPIDTVAMDAAALVRRSGYSVHIDQSSQAHVSAAHATLRDALAGMIEVCAAQSGTATVTTVAAQRHVSLTITAVDPAGLVAPLLAEAAMDSASAFLAAARRVAADHAGGIEVIDDGLVLWLPPAYVQQRAAS